MGSPSSLILRTCLGTILGGPVVPSHLNQPTGRHLPVPLLRGVPVTAPCFVPRQLTATKAGRRVVRERGTYVVLRELHRWEQDPAALAACEKLIQVRKRRVLGEAAGSGGVPDPEPSFPSWDKVLIGDEPGPGMENLLEVNVPEELEKELQRLDGEEEERWRREEEEREARGSTPHPEEPSQ